MMNAKINGLEAGARKLGVRMRHFMWVRNRKPLTSDRRWRRRRHIDVRTCRHDTFNSTGVTIDYVTTAFKQAETVDHGARAGAGVTSCGYLNYTSKNIFCNFSYQREYSVNFSNELTWYTGDLKNLWQLVVNCDSKSGHGQGIIGLTTII